MHIIYVKCLAVLRGHVGSVNRVTVLENGRVVSASDKTLRVWDIDKLCRCLAVLKGHTNYISAVMEDGRIVSGSSMGQHVARWELPVLIWRLEDDELKLCKGELNECGVIKDDKNYVRTSDRV